MHVRWMTAFVDRPADGFEATVDFWGSVSGSTLSPWRGDDAEFATLLPADGADPHLRVQRVAAGPGGSHLDLHVDDIPAGAGHCRHLGAELVADAGTHLVLASPGGMPFCLVADRGERRRQAPVESAPGRATLVDQLSIDVDPDRFETEVAFWSAVTGWPTSTARAPEFVPLERSAAQPLRILLQRRAAPSGPTSCHLDLACDDVEASVLDHEARGATVVGAHRYWTVLTDPSGVAYCLTRRQPTTGLLAPAG